MNRKAILVHLLISSLWLSTLTAQVQKNVIEKPVKAAANPDRADMDRLLTDIQNHNRKLGEVLSSKDLTQVRQTANYLREDVKSLVRKSTGLPAKETDQLHQRMTNIVELTQRLERKAAESDYAAANAHYQNLQRHIVNLKTTAANEAALAGSARNPDLDRLLSDIDNHNRKLADVISSKNTAEVKKEAFALREDVKSLAGKSTGLSATESAQLQQKMNQVIDVTERLENKAEASDYAAVKGDYEKLQPIVKNIQAVAGETRQARERTTISSTEQVEVGSEVQRLLTDINNHNARLRELISAKDFTVVKEESLQLREDVKALVKNSTGLSKADQTRLQDRVDNIVDLTERLERNADRSDASGLRTLHQRLQAQIKGIQTLVTGIPEKNR